MGQADEESPVSICKSIYTVIRQADPDQSSCCFAASVDEPSTSTCEEPEGTDMMSSLMA